jgi:hypothetical protein
VQLPINYYPGLFGVRDNGQPVAYGSLESWLAVALGPGDHTLDVRFVGCVWANYLSAGVWMLVLLGLLATVVVPGVTALAAACRGLGTLRAWPLPLRVGVVAAVVACGLPVVALGLLRLTVLAPPLIASVQASSVLSPLHEAAYAVDGRDLTAWAAASGDPAFLHLYLHRTVRLGSLELLSRGTNLYEGWHEVKVRLYRGDQLVLEQQFSFADAATKRLEVAHFAPTGTDHIELLLSKPVTISPWGKPAGRPVNPGYSEIRLGYE